MRALPKGYHSEAYQSEPGGVTQGVTVVIGFWFICKGTLHDRRLTCLEKATSLTGDGYDGSETNGGNFMAFQEASDLFSFGMTDYMICCKFCRTSKLEYATYL